MKRFKNGTSSYREEDLGFYYCTRCTIDVKDQDEK